MIFCWEKLQREWLVPIQMVADFVRAMLEQRGSGFSHF